MDKPDILLLNLESVNRYTFDMLPPITRGGPCEVPDAWSTDAEGHGMTTVGFYRQVLGDNLIGRLRLAGYTTHWLTEWNYYPKSYPPIKGRTQSDFDDWLVAEMDHYHNAYPEGDTIYDVRRLFARMRDDPGPFFAVFQPMDTHTPFRSAASESEWFPYPAAMEAAIGDEVRHWYETQEDWTWASFGHGLASIAYNDVVRLRDLHGYDEFCEIRDRARRLQLLSLQGVLAALAEFI